MDMNAQVLPSKDSADLHLVVATYEELVQQQHANSDEWRGALSLEQYIKREELLYDQDLTRDGGLTPWLLVHQPDSSSGRVVLCGCETINKKALRAENGKIMDVVCHGVASVFCPPKYRGRGYAGRMMTDLGRKLKHWQADRGKISFSVLYSDIGKDFYAARGWHPFPSAHITLPASTAPQQSTAGALRADDLPQLCADDERLLRQQLPKSSVRTIVAIVPDYRTVAWHHAREEYVAQILHGQKPQIRGAIVGDKAGPRVFAYWTRVWSSPAEEAPSTLHILRLVIEDEAPSDFAPASGERAAELKDSPVALAIAAIFSVAQAEAAQWGLQEVCIWNPTSATLAGAQCIDANVRIQHREKESIASLQWYGDAGSSWKDVDWVCNEKYGWC